MAKKKSKRKAAPKAKIIVPLETQFNCPFCNHERVCEVKM
jgi:transcription elongation factor Elf1